MGVLWVDKVWRMVENGGVGCYSGFGGWDWRCGKRSYGGWEVDSGRVRWCSWMVKVEGGGGGGRWYFWVVKVI